MFKLACILALALTVAAAGGNSPSPYKGQESRDIKALSEQEVSDLQTGEGMGFAKAAELNGYPGPAHVLQLAEQLELNAEQLANTEEIFRDMKAQAIEAGKDLVEQERELDRQFQEKAATMESLRLSLAGIADLRAELRRIHLHAHLQQAELLSDAQIRAYYRLRGYGGSDRHVGPPAHPH